MIHLIYIYFIVNAFIAGIWFIDNKGFSLTMFVFGIPMYMILACWILIREPIVWIENNALFLGWYRLYFTNYFEKMDNHTIEIRRAQYLGKTKNINANRYQRFFLRQLDKKYNYGITRKETRNES